MSQQHRHFSDLNVTQIDGRFEPSDVDEGLTRALFLTHAVHAHWHKLLGIFLDKCRSGEFGQETSQVLAAGTSEENIALASKELVTASIHIAGLDQGGPNAPMWLIRLLFESQQESDEMLPEPFAADIIAELGEMELNSMLEAIAGAIAERFDLPAEDRIDDWLFRALESSRLFVSELLVFALSQPIEALQDHLSLYD